MPFHSNPFYLNASDEMKQRVLTSGWLIYNYKTEAIETRIVNPACVDIIAGQVPGLNNVMCREVAAQTMTDESYHTLMVLNANNITEEARGFKLTLPDFALVTKLNEFQARMPHEWQRTLLRFITAAISEMHISDYLKLLSNETSIQDINRLTVKAHYSDEIRHGSIFPQYMKCVYNALSLEQ